MVNSVGGVRVYPNTPGFNAAQRALKAASPTPCWKCGVRDATTIEHSPPLSATMKALGLANAYEWEEAGGQYLWYCGPCNYRGSRSGDGRRKSYRRARRPRQPQSRRW